MGAQLMKPLAATMALALIVTGCGEGSASDEKLTGATVTTSSLSKAAFIKRASAACIREGKKLNTEVAAYMKKHGFKGLPESVLLANLVKTVVLPSIEAQSAAMHELGAPAGDEEKVDAIVEAQQEGIEQVKQLERLKSTEVIEGYFADMNEGLEAYGFTACIYG